MIHRLIAWGHYPDAALAVLAQVETIVEKGLNVAEKFGNGDDSLRFGITIVALFLVIGFLAYLYLANVRATLQEQNERIKSLEKELRDLHNGHERKYDELHDDYERKLSGYYGWFEIAVRELANNNRWLQDQGYVPRRHEIQPPPPPPPPSPAAPPSDPGRRSQFLPFSQQSRRVPRRPGGTHEDANES